MTTATGVFREVTDDWSGWVDLPGGYQARTKIEPDHNTNLSEDGDWFGSIHWPGPGRGHRPEGCDGAAEKILTRDGYLWWQPPADAKADPVVRARLAERVRGYYLGHWCYVGVVVEVAKPACPHCGERGESETASLWGIESDAGDHLVETANDLVDELLSEVSTTA